MRRKLALILVVTLVLTATCFATLTTKFLISISIQNQKALDLNTVKDTVALDWTISLADGTGANQADTAWHDQRTLADGATETIDVNDGSLYDAFGTALTLSKLKLIAIKNGSSDADLEIGGAVATQLGLFKDVSDILNLPPGGKFIFTAPLAAGITLTTNGDLKLTHDGTGSSTLTYDIIVIGVD